MYQDLREVGEGRGGRGLRKLIFYCLPSSVSDFLISQGKSQVRVHRYYSDVDVSDSDTTFRGL